MTFGGETTALFAPYYDLYPLETSANLVDWKPLALLQRTNATLDPPHFLDPDAQFVLDELGRLNAADPRFAGRLDLDKMGMFGHSLGGATAAQLCLRDPRCKAGAAMDGSYFETNLLTRTLSVPDLFFRAGDGPAPDPANGLPDGRPDDRLAVNHHLVTNAYWVKLVSTIHLSFGDADLIFNAASMAAYWNTPTSGQFLPPARVTQVVRAYLLAFFNKYLRGEDDHLLDGPSPAYPEVMQFLK